MKNVEVIINLISQVETFSILLRNNSAQKMVQKLEHYNKDINYSILFSSFNQLYVFEYLNNYVNCIF